MVIAIPHPICFFFFQAEDGIRDHCVTGVQTCALPISWRGALKPPSWAFMIPSRRAWIFHGWSSRMRRCGGRWTTRDTGRYNSGPMNAGTKFAVGAVLIVGSVGYLMASGVKQTGQRSEERRVGKEGRDRRRE